MPSRGPLNSRNAAAEMQRSAVRGLRVIGEDLLGRAQRDAPVDEGTLRGSGDVEILTEAGQTVARVSFNTPYAAVQHERTDFKHPKGGKAHYLGDNLKAMAGRYEQALARLVRI